MGEAAKKLKCTWDDYRRWDDGQRWEIVGGVPYLVSPAPATRHQRVLLELVRQMATFFDGKPCEVFPAPTDVKLSDEDIVQPDILVVCEAGQVTPTHIEGAPTLVVEVLSPSTASHDRIRKLGLYARHGVKEVWLVTPYPWMVEVFVLDGGSYRVDRVYGKEETLESRTFPGLSIRLPRVFDYPIDPAERIEMVKEGRPEYGEGTDGANIEHRTSNIEHRTSNIEH